MDKKILYGTLIVVIALIIVGIGLPLLQVPFYPFIDTTDESEIGKMNCKMAVAQEIVIPDGINEIDRILFQDANIGSGTNSVNLRIGITDILEKEYTFIDSSDIITYTGGMLDFNNLEFSVVPSNTYYIIIENTESTDLMARIPVCDKDSYGGGNAHILYAYGWFEEIVIDNDYVLTDFKFQVYGDLDDPVIDDDDDDDWQPYEPSTPGFEVIVLLTAVTMLFIYKRRKN